MTEPKTDAWMPLWIGAYLADTMTFTTAQHGAYLLMLMAYWRERAPLTDDDESLRGITKTSKPEWKAMRPVLARKFRIADGVWWHKRVEQEMASADARSKKARDKAEKAAAARWGAKPEHATSNAPSIPQALPEQCPTPSPTPIPSLREGGEPRKRVPPIPRPDDVTEQVWGDWVQLRKTKRSTVSQTVVDEARAEAGKAGMSLDRFLTIWCMRGSQGLQADWLRAEERRPLQRISGNKNTAAAAGFFPAPQSNSEVIDV